MTDSEATRELAAAKTLMDERRRFEQWIAALDARRDTTPEHVFARVHADYERRLASVVEKLVAHGDALEARATELQVEMDVLAQDETHARDERAELELRAHVGELAEKEFNKAVKGIDESLSKLTGRRGELEAELQSIGELLSAVRVKKPARTSGATEAAAVVDEELAREEEATAAASLQSGEPLVQHDEEPEPLASDDAFRAALATPGTQRPSRPVKLTDEPELFDAEANQPPATDVAPVIEEPGVDAHPAGEDDRRSVTPSNTFDELAFLNSVVADAADKDTGEQAPADSGPKMRGSREALAINVTGNHPIVLKAAEGNAQQKSLKCNECGTLNYPTDWYCERCGAELAAL